MAWIAQPAKSATLDSLTDSFSPDSLTAVNWEDSARTEVSSLSSARWTMASRGDEAKRSLSVKHDQSSLVSLEFQHSDPGGLRRRSLTLAGESFRLTAGDLSAWSDHPLMEGTSRQSGKRDTTLGRQLLYGTGMRPNGIDLDASWEMLRVRSRSRWERDAIGNPRGSSVALIEAGPVSAGVRSSDSAGAPTTHLFEIGLNSSFGKLQTALVDGPGSDGAAVFGELELEGDATRLQAKIRHIQERFRHDGLASNWKPGTVAWIGLRRELSADADIGMQLDGGRDTLEAVRARGSSELNLGSRDLGLRVRATLSENDPTAPRWSTGFRMKGRIGYVSPTMEISVSDSAGRQVPSGLIGARMARAEQELSATSSYSVGRGPAWNASHKTQMAAGYVRLDFTLSASGSWRPASSIAAQGSVACAW